MMIAMSMTSVIAMMVSTVIMMVFVVLFVIRMVRMMPFLVMGVATGVMASVLLVGWMIVHGIRLLRLSVFLSYYFPTYNCYQTTSADANMCKFLHTFYINLYYTQSI